jgi:thiol-disulfide isomerase/thioredoxin
MVLGCLLFFFPENGTTMFKLYPMDKFSENQLSNNGLNASLNAFNKDIAQKFQKKNTDFFKQNEELGYDNLNSETYNNVISKLNKVTTGEERVLLYDELEKLKEAGLDRSQLGKERDTQYAVILNEYFNDRYNYIQNNRTLVSYAFLIEDLMYQDSNVIGKERMLSAFNALKQKYPNHSYTKLGYSLLRALNDLNPGGNYVNFTAPDIDGDIIEFKDVLKENKIVLLDLWATWCGPCIAKTRLVRPIYEKYKHKGFTILGVAGERRNLDKFHVFMEKEQWPWQQLIELAGENKIWEKYNVMNSGGGMFLIDSSGEILAVDPSAEEVDTILNQRL